MTEPGKLNISEEAIPLLCEAVDLKSLNITPEEGFILSRIDGQVRVRHLVSLTGLGKEQTLKLIQSLVEKGAITIHQPRQERKAKPREEKAPARIIIDPAKVPKGEGFKEYVEKLYEILPKIDYFQLLGVKRDASKKEIKKAYFQLSKVFHPDRYYRKVEPEFRRRLQEVFKHINTAYQVLLDPQRKEEYLNQLKERGVEGADFELSLEVSKKVYTGPKLKLGLTRDKEEVKKEKLEKMKEKLKKSPIYGQVQKAERIYQLALEDIRRGNFKSARTNLKLAIQLDPLGGKKYQKELERLEQLEKQNQAEVLFQQGLSAQESGDYQLAYRKYSEALKIAPENPKILFRSAEIMVKYLNSFERARGIILKLLEIDEKKPEYYYLLGLAYKGLGQKRAAEVQFEKALALNPRLKEAQKELKALKRG